MAGPSLGGISGEGLRQTPATAERCSYSSLCLPSSSLLLPLPHCCTAGWRDVPRTQFPTVFPRQSSQLPPAALFLRGHCLLCVFEHDPQSLMHSWLFLLCLNRTWETVKRTTRTGQSADGRCGALPSPAHDREQWGYCAPDLRAPFHLPPLGRDSEAS